MKRTTKIIALALAAVIVCGILVSCSTMLSGVYSGELGGSILGGKASYNFKGSKVTITVTVTVLGTSNSTSYDGAYEITAADDGTQSITFTFADAEAKEYSGTYSFTQNKDAKTITIGGVTYSK